MPGSARAVVILDRISKVAEGTFDTTIHRIKRHPDEPPSLRVALPAIALGGGHAYGSGKVPAGIKLTFQYILCTYTPPALGRGPIKNGIVLDK